MNASVIVPFVILLLVGEWFTRQESSSWLKM